MKIFFAMSAALFISIIAGAQFTIIVDEIPGNTPENDDIYIAGDFQNWDPGSITHKLSKDTEQNSFSITLPAGTGDIEFKFTRGNWAKVESDELGKYIPNRFYSPSEGDTLYLQILGWEDLDGNGSGVSTAAENVSILTDSFYMTQFDRYRRIWIYLPPDYHETDYSYPVLYMHDGQNVFDDLTSFAGEWEVDETLNKLHAEGDRGIIVVGIDNGQNLRIDEYTPWPNESYGGGDGAIYVDFLVQELKPYIDLNYRTLADRENTGIMGSSLGGLISTYAGIEYQDVFSKIGSFSPAYWINPEAFSHVSSKGKIKDMKIYQLGGSLEGSDFITKMFAMNDTLLQSGFGPDEINTIEKSDGQHSEWFWAREFKDAYLWLFGSTDTYAKEPEAEENTFRLYPNPARESINFIGISDESVAKIYNSNGQLLLSRNLGSRQDEINVSELPSGMYILKLICDKNLLVRQFTKE